MFIFTNQNNCHYLKTSGSWEKTENYFRQLNFCTLNCWSRKDRKWEKEQRRVWFIRNFGACSFLMSPWNCIRNIMGMIQKNILWYAIKSLHSFKVNFSCLRNVLNCFIETFAVVVNPFYIVLYDPLYWRIQQQTHACKH